MSTRSSIAILNNDGSVDSIYCHNDGYPKGVGYALAHYHDNEEDAEHIIELGNMSVLDIKLDPTGKGHSFEHPEPDVSIFYGRDRGEKHVEAKHWECFDDWFEMASDFYWANYCYWWDGEMWHCQAPYDEKEVYLY